MITESLISGTLNPVSSPPSASLGAEIPHEAFSGYLRSAGSPGRVSRREEEAMTAAQQLVATAFIRPILAELGEANFASDRFQPGAGEKRMRPLLDAEIGDRIASSPGFPLVEAVRDRLLGRERSVEVFA